MLASIPIIQSFDPSNFLECKIKKASPCNAAKSHLNSKYQENDWLIALFIN